MTRLLICLLLATAALIGSVAPVSAQTQKPILPVLGAGSIAFDYTAPTRADLDLVTFKAYMSDGRIVNVPTTCVIVAGSLTDYNCTFPIASLGLSGNAISTFELAATAIFADGEGVSDKADAPFSLRLAAPPAGPKGDTFKIRPRQ